MPRGSEIEDTSTGARVAPRPQAVAAAAVAPAPARRPSAPAPSPAARAPAPAPKPQVPAPAPASRPAAPAAAKPAAAKVAPAPAPKPTPPTKAAPPAPESAPAAEAAGPYTPPVARLFPGSREAWAEETRNRNPVVDTTESGARFRRLIGAPEPEEPQPGTEGQYAAWKEQKEQREQMQQRLERAREFAQTMREAEAHRRLVTGEPLTAGGPGEALQSYATGLGRTLLGGGTTGELPLVSHGDDAALAPYSVSARDRGPLGDAKATFAPAKPAPVDPQLLEDPAKFRDAAQQLLTSLRDLSSARDAVAADVLATERRRQSANSTGDVAGRVAAENKLVELRKRISELRQKEADAAGSLASFGLSPEEVRAVKQ